MNWQLLRCLVGLHDWDWLTSTGYEHGDLFCRVCGRIRYAHPVSRRLEQEARRRDRERETDR